MGRFRRLGVVYVDRVPERPDLPIPETWSPRALLYEQVAEHIAARIAAGRWPTDVRMPSEFELAEEYSVARVTIRSAMRTLAERGLVVVIQGRGSFVIPPEERGGSATD